MTAYTKADQARRKGGKKPPKRIAQRGSTLKVQATPAICPPYPHPATEIQHQVQTSLDPSIENLLDVHHWIASCHDANTWCGVHPLEAQALGLELTPRQREHASAAPPAVREETP